MKVTPSLLQSVVHGTLDRVENPGALLDTAKISFDSRSLSQGDLFIALRTDKQDGAAYIKDAQAKGAALTLAERNPDNLPNVVVVPDALTALQALGTYVRAHYQGRVIGLTGSSGKTTSKELLAHMLSRFARTYRSEGSFNNHIGTPYNLCRLDETAPYAVFELGMDHAGEIAALVRLVQPNVLAVINVFPMHMEYFQDLRGVARAKAEIFEGATAYQGALPPAIINADAPFADEILIPTAKERGLTPLVTFGRNGFVRLVSFETTQEGKTAVSLQIEGKTYAACLPGLGERFAYNAAFAAAAAYTLGLDIDTALDAITDFFPPKGRGKTSRVVLDGARTITLIDDSYNGQPEAVRYAIASLASMPRRHGRKIALLGKMAEIGARSEDEHRSIGTQLAATDIDIVIGVGDETKALLDAVPETKTKIFRETACGLLEELETSLLQDGDLLLIKGAHYASRVFEIAAGLLAKSAQPGESKP
ncbi:MAG: UDP-N-acetylmuramoyl-tripeptide--D-alanyl-D-alanine ligase [Alphaproteobacteria bacterium]|nr:UDP-N-acetylmuramoyl-tripeptide--D-alanyl-D-alanine ligase [Alphaproteobacteria bacterium]